jgi:hypothetical protein
MEAPYPSRLYVLARGDARPLSGSSSYGTPTVDIRIRSAAQQAASMRADFNQAGFADLAVGDPGDDVGELQSAGASACSTGRPVG